MYRKNDLFGNGQNILLQTKSFSILQICNFQIIVTIIAFAAVAHAKPDAPATIYDYPAVNPAYSFGYNVINDEPQAFQHEENRDGHQTHGEFSIDLPDGRRQIGKSNFQLEVDVFPA